MTAPPQNGPGRPQSRSGGPESQNGAEQSYGGPPQAQNGAEQSYGGPTQGQNGAEQSYGGSPQAQNGGGQSYGGPAQGQNGSAQPSSGLPGYLPPEQASSGGGANGSSPRAEAPAPEVNRVRLVGALALVVALAATAGFAFHRVFAVGDLLPVIAVSAVVPVVLSAVISWPRRRPWPLWTSIAATLAAWTLIVCVTLFGSFAPTAVGGALRDSWKAILTTLLPAPGEARFLVLPHVLIWLAAMAGAEIALRSKTKIAAALPAVVVFGVALVLGVGGPSTNLPVVAAFVGFVMLLGMVRTGARPTWILGGLPAAAALGVAVAFLGPYLPVKGHPYDPRQAVKAPPPETRDSVSPLDRVGAWLQNPYQQMFTVHANKSENWRLAVLDRFDGETWSSGAQFVPSGSSVPGALPGTRTQVDQKIQIQGLPGIWVPAADRPRSVKGLGVTVDPGSGALTSAQPLRHGQSYDVTSSVRQFSADELAGAQAADDAAARAAVAVPETPAKPREAYVPQFRQLAQQITQGENSPFQRAAKLAEWLSTHAKYTTTALPGHGYRQLMFFLTSTKQGTSEQFAALYAVMARSIGLPTRLVVGFRPGYGGDGQWQVRSGDVLVWPEVDFAGLGWLPFYPTPDQSGSRGSKAVPTGEAQQKLQAAQKNAASRQKGNGQGKNNQPPPKKHDHESTGGTPVWVYPAISGGVLVLLYLLGALIIPMIRRNGRTRGLPPQRIEGAWRQTLESLQSVGLRRVVTLSAHEIARYGARRVKGAEAHLRPLADLINRAEYAANPPSPEAADGAWEHADQITKLVTQTTTPLRRLTRRLHPRSLDPRP